MKANSGFEVDLYFSATNLQSKDSFSKSDPFLAMSMQQSMNGNVQPLGRTESQPNTTYPTWNQKITAQYYFEFKQFVLLEVYDEDSTSKSQFIGKCETNLGAIMGAHLQMLQLDLVDHHGKIVGKITVRA